MAVRGLAPERIFPPAKSQADNIAEDIEREGVSWLLLRRGLFDGSVERIADMADRPDPDKMRRITPRSSILCSFSAMVFQLAETEV